MDKSISAIEERVLAGLTQLQRDALIYTADLAIEALERRKGVNGVEAYLAKGDWKYEGFTDLAEKARDNLVEVAGDLLTTAKPVEEYRAQVMNNLVRHPGEMERQVEFYKQSDVYAEKMARLQSQLGVGSRPDRPKT